MLMSKEGDVKLESGPVGSGSSFLMDLAKTGAGALINGVGSYLSMKAQAAEQRKMLDYQWDKMYSPQSQVRNLTSAGVNPAVAFGNQSPVLNSGGQLGSVDAPTFGIGTTSLSDLANYIKAKADAKKAGADTRKTEAEADALNFENQLNYIFKKSERVANLMSAYKAIQLQDDEHSRNEWINAKEKALSQLTGIQKDTAQKVFDNMDTQIQQENKQREEDIKLTQEKQKTEKTSQSANTASARASNTQAEINSELKKIHSIEREVLEAGKVDRVNAYLAELREKKMLSDERYQELRERIRSIKNRQDYADKHKWYGDFLNTMDDLSFYLSKFNPLNMVKPTDIAPSK